MSVLRPGKKSLQIVLPIVVIIVMMLWLTGAFRKGRIQGGKVPVETRSAVGVPAYTATMERTPIISEAVGSIQPEFKMAISPRVSANVMEMRVRAGQRVQANELLARLDDRDLRSRVNQARESMRRAEATRNLATSDYKRDKPLFDKAVIPRSEFDQTDMRLRTAAADLDRAREALREAQVTLSYAEIRSPAFGVVIDKLADVGDLAVPGKALLNLYEPDHLWLEANVREQEASRLQLGATYRVRIEATGQEIAGRLAEIVPSADPVSRTVIARAALPADTTLYPGMFGRLLIPLREAEVLFIPAQALIRVGQLTLVDVIAGEVLQRRAVQIGTQRADRIEILSGLVPGEQVALPRTAGAAP